MTEDESSLIDSSILIYAYDSSEKEKHKIAENILAKCWKKEIHYFLSTQNLSELYINITRYIKNPIPKEEAEENLKDIITFPNFQILTIEPQTIKKAINISIKYNLNYWDALIAAVMQENSINTIITENKKDFEKISWLTITNPFEKS